MCQRPEPTQPLWEVAPTGPWKLASGTTWKPRANAPPQAGSESKVPKVAEVKAGVMKTGTLAAELSPSPWTANACQTSHVYVLPKRMLSASRMALRASCIVGSAGVKNSAATTRRSTSASVAPAVSMRSRIEARALAQISPSKWTSGK